MPLKCCYELKETAITIIISLNNSAGFYLFGKRSNSWSFIPIKTPTEAKRLYHNTGQNNRGLGSGFSVCYQTRTIPIPTHSARSASPWTLCGRCTAHWCGRSRLHSDTGILMHSPSRKTLGDILQYMEGEEKRSETTALKIKCKYSG